MLPYITSDPSTNDTVGKSFQFPYGVGKVTGERMTLWSPHRNLVLRSNLKTKYDVFGVNDKLRRLGFLIEEGELPIEHIWIARRTSDTIEVETTLKAGPQEWLRFAKLLSTSFCLAVKL